MCVVHSSLDKTPRLSVPKLFPLSLLLRAPSDRCFESLTSLLVV